MANYCWRLLLILLKYASQEIAKPIVPRGAVRAPTDYVLILKRVILPFPSGPLVGSKHD